MTLFVPKEYGYCLLSVATMGLHCMSQAAMVGKARKKVGLKYPDQGNGKYAQKLTDDEWFEFNCAQRGHQHYLEIIAPTAIFALIAGLECPTTTAALVCTVMVGRQLYGSGYRAKGPEGRRIGAMLSIPTVFVLFAMAVFASLRISELF